MSRTPKPWFWKERQSWFVTIRGERKNLGPDKREAVEEFHRLMCRPCKKSPLRADFVVAIIDQFLDWVQKNRAEATYRWYQDPLELFARRYPGLAVDELKPLHVQQWIDSYPDLAPGSKRNYARTIVRTMAWAEEQGLIERSPIARFKKPKAGVRQTVITPEEYAAILDLVPNETMRDLLTFAWETGARAAECLAIEKRHVDLSSHRIVFPIDEEKMQRAPRVIYLTDAAEEIVRRLVLQHPSGPIFRNSNGTAWTTEAVNCAFVALQIHTGLPAQPSTSSIAR